jgi:hypothetical protein
MRLGAERAGRRPRSSGPRLPQPALEGEGPTAPRAAGPAAASAQVGGGVDVAQGAPLTEGDASGMSPPTSSARSRSTRASPAAAPASGPSSGCASWANRTVTPGGIVGAGPSEASTTTTSLVTSARCSTA